MIRAEFERLEAANDCLKDYIECLKECIDNFHDDLVDLSNHRHAEAALLRELHEEFQDEIISLTTAKSSDLFFLSKSKSHFNDVQYSRMTLHSADDRCIENEITWEELGFDNDKNRDLTTSQKHKNDFNW